MWRKTTKEKQFSCSILDICWKKVIDIKKEEHNILFIKNTQKMKTWNTRNKNLSFYESTS